MVGEGLIIEVLSVGLLLIMLTLGPQNAFEPTVLEHQFEFNLQILVVKWLDLLIESLEALDALA